MNTTPREETVSDEELADLVDLFEPDDKPLTWHTFDLIKRVLIELQSRRSAQPADRAAIIEEQGPSDEK